MSLFRQESKYMMNVITVLSGIVKLHRNCNITESEVVVDLFINITPDNSINAYQ